MERLFVALGSSICFFRTDSFLAINTLQCSLSSPSISFILIRSEIIALFLKGIPHFFNGFSHRLDIFVKT